MTDPTPPTPNRPWVDLITHAATHDWAIQSVAEGDVHTVHIERVNNANVKVAADTQWVGDVMQGRPRWHDGFVADYISLDGLYQQIRDVT